METSAETHITSTADAVTDRKLLPRYALVTPARNEAAFIRSTIESMVRQTVLPVKWVIVNDGSTDDTARIAQEFAAKYQWIELLNLPIRKDRSFAAKVYAFNAGLEVLKGLEYDLIGNLDADVALDTDHFEFLLGKFSADPRLGVAGTVFSEEGGYSSERDSLEGQLHVSGQCQLFRRQCFADVGGYVANRAGGIDWIAVTTARMKGWKTRSYREKSFLHHRHLGTAERSAFAAGFSYGEKDYYLGGHPLWELFRVAFRMAKGRYLLEGLALGLGFGWAALRRVPRPIPPELVAFHRREQMKKLKIILKSLLAGKRVDKFTILAE